MKSMKKAVSILLSVVLWAVILVAALFTFTTMATRDASHVASVGGYTPMAVQSDSMLPVFKKGDMILIRACDPASLAVGDIVCFHTIIENQYALNTHRIVEIRENDGYRSYVTKGENNLISDQHVIADEDIVGRYVGKVGGLGKLMDFLSSSTGFLLIIVLPLLLFFIYQVYHLIMVSINLKKAAALEAAKAQAEMQAPAVDAEAARLKAEAEQARAEAEAALEEARRLKAEAEALKARETSGDEAES